LGLSGKKQQETAENCTEKSFMNYTAQEILIGNQIKNEMGREYGRYV